MVWGTRVAGAAIPPGLHGVAFNASLCVNATPAVLFRLIEETRPTLLVDEAEALDTDNRPPPRRRAPIMPVAMCNRDVQP